ncbi:MAG: oligosaccharide flippase family protein, partial [Chitinophagaceae bacterium]|nr:oligosaccharide flippase family protein [Chitinophagaceae bacterium]
MLSRFLKGGEYFKNSVTLISGTTFSQLIPFIFAPILARIYPPDNYGMLGIYMAVSSLFGLLATFQYSSAIILAETDNDANGLLLACFGFTGLVALVTFVIMLLLHYPIASALSAPETAKWLLLSPVSVLFMGANATLSAYTNRIRQYKTLAMNRILTTLISALLSLVIGLAIKSELGLMAGYIGGQIIGTLFLLYSLRKSWPVIFGRERFNITEIKQTLKKYISFPKFVLFSEFINNFINYIPVFLLSKLSGPATVGLYNMSTRMLGIPIATVSTAIGEVFRQKAAKEYNETGSCKP